MAVTEALQTPAQSAANSRKVMRAGLSGRDQVA
jgi:hypothetical protein